MTNHAAIILRDENKVLFVQRSANKKSLPNIWAFPSGTIEEGESPEETTIREAKEELGIDIEIEKSLATVELPELGARLHFVTCTSKHNGNIVCDPNEIQATKWLTFKEFFNEFTDEEIGHGLIHLRKHPEIWHSSFN
ncbi:MAG: NUDIX domain-containing protein [Parcubacteria group bacterium]|nr:NUDIX domain-containing protein [Parcubacteria group bacterium]